MLRHVGALLGASLLLAGCSLSLPEDGALFEPDDTKRGAPDAAAEAEADADTGPVDATSEAASDDAGFADARTDVDAADGGSEADALAETGASDDAGQPDSATGLDASTDEDGSEDAGPDVFDPAAGLVLHYRFNESTGDTVHDFAGGGDGIVVGAPDGHEQWVSAGRIDGALSLAGAAGVDADTGIGHHVALPQGLLLGLEECSISMWINRAGGPMWQRVFDFGSGQPVWLYFTPHGGTGLPIVAGRTPAQLFVDYVQIEEAPEGEGRLRINTPIPVSTWVHFVLTWSGDSIKVYLDGKLAGETLTHGGVAPTDLGNTGQNYLGRSQFVADPYFDGMLDELRIYDHVLTASDVAELHGAQ